MNQSKPSTESKEEPKYKIWYEYVKQELLKSEPANILARAKCFSNIVNETINYLLTELNISYDILQNTTNMYSCNINPLNHLQFLTNWNGLKIENTEKPPQNQKEYEKKSKNWLNGRRAPNYGNSLFPWFIEEIQNFSMILAKKFFNNDKQISLFCDIFIYKMLTELCACSVSLHEQAKKAPFFCKNSLERKCKLRNILQKYAQDHLYVKGFPSCFEEAVNYFGKKM